MISPTPPPRSTDRSGTRLKHIQIKSKQLASRLVSVSLPLKLSFQNFSDIEAKLKYLERKSLAPQAKS